MNSFPFHLVSASFVQNCALCCTILWLENSPLVRSVICPLPPILSPYVFLFLFQTLKSRLSAISSFPVGLPLSVVSFMSISASLCRYLWSLTLLEQQNQISNYLILRISRTSCIPLFLQRLSAAASTRLRSLHQTSLPFKDTAWIPPAYLDMMFKW